MSSYVQLITSKPVMTNVANSLKIPTIQGKKIIKMNSPPVLMRTYTMTDSPDQKIPIASSVTGTAKCEPPSSDKIGGLFDPEEEGNYARTTYYPVELMINHQATFRPVSKLNLTNSIVDKSYLDMDTEHFDFNDFNNNQSACLTPSTPIVTNDITIQIPVMPKKKFSDKLSDANLKINIVKPNMTTCGQLDTTTPFLDLDLEDLELNKIMTPSIEKECLQYLQAIQADENSNILKSARILTNNQIMSSLGVNDVVLDSMLNTGGLPSSTIENNNVFLSQTSASLNLPAVNESKSKPPALTLNDHVYSNINNKRPITSLLEGDETSSASFASDALNSSVSVPGTSASLTSGSKRQRTRGIYRAEDITNEDDLQNYLERRKKNNISSKISRANKKNYYSQMDERSVALENENRKLEVKVQKLEELNKLMKDYLINNFSNKIK